MYHTAFLFSKIDFSPRFIDAAIGIACFCSGDLYGLVNVVISTIVPVISLNSVFWKLQLGSLVSSNDHLGSIFAVAISAFIPSVFAPHVLRGTCNKITLFLFFHLHLNFRLNFYLSISIELCSTFRTSLVPTAFKRPTKGPKHLDLCIIHLNCRTNI